MQPDTWRMTTEVQVTTLVIAAGLVWLVIAGMIAILREWQRRWAIEDYTTDYIPECEDVVSTEQALPDMRDRR